VRGRARLPGDKSISHRAALLAAVAVGRPVRVSNFSTSADCASTLSCLARLGVALRREETSVIIQGGARLPRPPRAPLDCGNSGTTLRLLAGILAGHEFTSTLTGDESLRSRPMRRIIEPLELMGARVASHDGRAPLTIHGRDELDAISYAPPVASAQVKSCVLLAGLRADGLTTVVERGGATRDHTERLLRWFDVEVRTRNAAPSEPATDPVRPTGAVEAATTDVDGRAATDVQAVSVEGGSRLRARDVAVPGDVSSAAFLLVAAAVLEGSDLTLEGVGLNPTRARVLEVLRALGADVTVTDEREESNEPAGDIRVRGAGTLAPSRAGANRVGGALSAALIDELPVLAVAGTRVEGGIEIRDAAELRVKESDRITATVANLRAMGAEVEEYEDGLTVAGPVRLRGAHLRSFGDHRVAMAAAVAALAAEGDTEIEGAECAAVSFPEFFPLLESIAVR
jgi:3-phosphoshikimate 1-carboxyvinyltransferase